MKGQTMRKAKDIMTRDVITVSPDTPVSELAKLLLERRINGVPVVDESGILFGIVTEADLVDQSKMLHIPSMFTFLDSLIFLESPKRLEKEIKKIAGTTVADICTREVVTVDEETPVDMVATLMAEKGVNTIPVMRDKRIVGIVGRGDIIRSLVG